MRIGILTGVQAEADAFLPDVAADRVDVAPLTLREVQVAQHAIRIGCCGIGKVNAAMAAMALVAHGVDLLMVIGTAGRLRVIAGDCFVISDAFQHDYGAARAQEFVAYPAGSWPMGPVTLTPFAAAALPDLGLPRARIVTGDGFIEAQDQAALLRDRFAADLVDMETGAVAQVAARLGLPWAAIKATTDDADGGSASAFEANLAAAARRAADAAVRMIGAM